MTKRIGVFVDIGDQFFRVSRKWEGERLSYEAFYNKAIEYGNITRAVAYGTQIGKSGTNFINCLSYIGYEPKFKDIEKEGQWFNWAVGISVDIMNCVNNHKIDTVILGASYKDIVPLILCIKDKGIKVIVIGCCANRELKLVADEYVEVTKNMLISSVIKSKDAEKPEKT